MASTQIVGGAWKRKGVNGTPDYIHVQLNLPLLGIFKFRLYVNQKKEDRMGPPDYNAMWDYSEFVPEKSDKTGEGGKEW